MLHPAQKILRYALLPLLAAIALYQWYLSGQVIDHFEADGLIVKVRQHSGKTGTPMIEVYDKAGTLKRLADKDLYIDAHAMRPGDSFFKQSGSTQALINQQIVDLKRH